MLHLLSLLRHASGSSGLQLQCTVYLFWMFFASNNSNGFTICSCIGVVLRCLALCGVVWSVLVGCSLAVCWVFVVVCWLLFFVCALLVVCWLLGGWCLFVCLLACLFVCLFVCLCEESVSGTGLCNTSSYSACIWLKATGQEVTHLTAEDFPCFCRALLSFKVAHNFLVESVSCCFERQPGRIPPIRPVLGGGLERLVSPVR